MFRKLLKKIISERKIKGGVWGHCIEQAQQQEYPKDFDAPEENNVHIKTK